MHAMDGWHGRWTQSKDLLDHAFWWEPCAKDRQEAKPDRRIHYFFGGRALVYLAGEQLFRREDG